MSVFDDEAEAEVLASMMALESMEPERAAEIYKQSGYTCAERSYVKRI